MTDADARSGAKRILGNLVLLSGACVLGLALSEMVLRVGMPRYSYAANARYDLSAVRIWSRVPHDVYTGRHPDTGEPHLIIHNNLGLRQHRDIPASRSAGEIRVGLFGDSFVENLRVAAPYSLSEPLEHLLRAGGAEATVLNFGVDGYGTDQSLLFYEESSAARELDHVIYVFCINDIRNLYENNLFYLDAKGELVRRPARVPPVWIR